MKRIVPVILLVFVLLGCAASEEESIDRLLKRREEAFEKRDLDLYLSCISKAYQNKDENFDRLKSRMEGYFQTFDRIGYSSWDRSIEIEGSEARVLQQFRLEVEKGGKPQRYSGKEWLFLRKEGGTWKIVGAL